MKKWIIAIALVAVVGCDEKARNVHYLPGGEAVYQAAQDKQDPEEKAECLSRIADAMRHFRLYKRGKEKITDFPYLAEYLSLCDLVGNHDALQTVEYLLKAGADPNQKTADGCSPLAGAAAIGDVESSRLLLKAGADVRMPDNDGWTPLHHAVAWANSVEICELLLAAGADVNAADKDGDTPLIVCAATNVAEVDEHLLSIWRLLISAGADAMAVNESGLSAYAFAYLKANRELCRDIEKTGVVKTPVTPLQEALVIGSVEECKAAIDAGADLEAHDCLGLKPLTYAVSSAGICPELLDILLAAGADPNKGGSLLDMPMVNKQAALYGSDFSSELKEELLTPLTVAFHYGEQGVDVCRKLLVAGADLQQISPRIRQRLTLPPELERFLSAESDPVIMQMLEEYMANEVKDAAVRERFARMKSGQENPKDFPWLATALQAGAPAEVVHGLLSLGCSADAADAQGESPLHIAVRRFAADARPLNRLLTAGAQPNPTDAHGRTPLHVAVACAAEQTKEGAAVPSAYLRLCKRLLAAGADPTLRSATGETAADMARRLNLASLVPVLSSPPVEQSSK